MKKKNMWISDTGDGSYRNPVLFADYSDPDVIRVGNDFYMVSSSFANVPAIPVLHSKDLVNWKVINYVCDRIPFDYYDNPCHGSGIWAPSIRFHDGLFYVCFPMPDEGIFMSTTIDPYEKWSEPVCIKKVKGWIDPCPFWDDDGKAYLVNAFSNGRIGIHSKLQMTQMSADGMSLIGESKIVFDGILRQPIIEGPKLYKRNGYYYIFAPAGTVKTGWETVLRSDNIWGPYEDRIALIQGGSTINGPHQGGVVDTANGEYWMLHFQHIEHAGRVVHLQPVVWEEDNWPTIGKKKWKGLGVPYTSHTKPDLDGDGIYAPDDSDSFDKPKLGLQWQWNANPKKEWYELDMRTQQLRLTSKPAKGNLYMQPNILLQKMNSLNYEVESCIICDEMVDGDMGGILCLGKMYAGIFVEAHEKLKRIIIINGTYKEVKEPDVITEWNKFEKIKLIMIVNGKEGIVHFSFSINCENNFKIKKEYQIRRGSWVGIKDGLCAINKKSQEGIIKVDYYNKI